jgi:uncharacterized membrane protein YheB (UPF0754 family)
MTMTSHSSNLVLVAIPLISALIGYVTNYIAVMMLFRPYTPKSLGIIKLHGLVPRRHGDIARSLGTLIERDLFSHNDIHAALQSAETTEEASVFLGEQVDLFIQNLSQQNPMIGMFVQGDLLVQVKEMLGKQMTEKFPSFMERVVERVEHKLDVSAIVQRKIEAFDITKLESIIYEVSARELKTIEYLGGVLGFIVGLVQVVLLVTL